MTNPEYQVVFANPKLETDYKRLASSSSAEDQKLYGTLARINAMLLKNHASGTEVPKDNLPKAYKQLFDIQNLWKLKLSDNDTVYYSYVGSEIRIVDVV